MSKKPKPSLATLISHWNAQVSGDYAGWVQEIQQGSDRVAGLLGGTLVDELLTRLLLKLLIEEPDTPQQERVSTKLLGPGGSLGNFNTKITMTFALGLIPADVYHDLGLIRKIRNAFAHTLQGITFQQETIAEACGKLKLPADVLAEPWREDLTPRLAFLVSVIHIALELDMRTRMAVQPREQATNDAYRPRWSTPVEEGEQPMLNPFCYLDPSQQPKRDSTDEE